MMKSPGNLISFNIINYEKNGAVCFFFKYFTLVVISPKLKANSKTVQEVEE